MRERRRAGTFVSVRYHDYNFISISCVYGNHNKGKGGLKNMFLLNSSGNIKRIFLLWTLNVRAFTTSE